MEAREWNESSGILTASSQISDEAGYFYGIILTTDGTTDATISFYDDVDAADADTKFLPDMVFATQTDLRDHKILLPYPIPCSTGCYIGVSVGQGAVAYSVLFRKRR